MCRECGPTEGWTGGRSEGRQWTSWRWMQGAENESGHLPKSLGIKLGLLMRGGTAGEVSLLSSSPFPFSTLAVSICQTGVLCSTQLFIYFVKEDTPNTRSS